MAPRTKSDVDRKPSDADSIGPGMNASGDVNVMTEEQARTARASRDAFDETFDSEDAYLDDDLSDLDDIDEITGSGK